MNLAQWSFKVIHFGGIRKSVYDFIHWPLSRCWSPVGCPDHCTVEPDAELAVECKHSATSARSPSWMRLNSERTLKTEIHWIYTSSCRMLLIMFFFHCFVSVLLIAVGPYTMSTTDHIGHKAWPYRPQGIGLRGGFCRMVLLYVPQLFRGSLFRAFMTKIKRIKIRSKVRSWGRLKMWDMKVQDWKIRHKPVTGKLWNCGMRKE